MTTFALLYDHKMDPRVFDNMIPWERDIYLQMLIQRIEEENFKAQMQASAARANHR